MHGHRKDFFQGAQLVDFSRGSQKDFSMRAKSGEISFFLLETKKTTFFVKRVTGKFQNPGGQGPPLLPFWRPLAQVRFHLSIFSEIVLKFILSLIWKITNDATQSMSHDVGCYLQAKIGPRVPDPYLWNSLRHPYPPPLLCLSFI